MNDAANDPMPTLAEATARLAAFRARYGGWAYLDPVSELTTDDIDVIVNALSASILDTVED